VHLDAVTLKNRPFFCIWGASCAEKQPPSSPKSETGGRPNHRWNYRRTKQQRLPVHHLSDLEAGQHGRTVGVPTFSRERPRDRPEIRRHYEKAKSCPNHAHHTAVHGHTWAYFATLKTRKLLEVLDFLEPKETGSGT
jgi:hypothetical protein